MIDATRDFMLRGAAFYTDDYVKADGRWRIQRTSYLRSYEEIQMRSQWTPPNLTASFWDTGGQSQLPLPEHIASLPRSSSAAIRE